MDRAGTATKATTVSRSWEVIWKMAETLTLTDHGDGGKKDGDSSSPVMERGNRRQMSPETEESLSPAPKKLKQSASLDSIPQNRELGLATVESLSLATVESSPAVAVPKKRKLSACTDLTPVIPGIGYKLDSPKTVSTERRRTLKGLDGVSCALCKGKSSVLSQKHLKKEHAGVCPVCLFGFASHELLNAHFTQEHGGWIRRAYVGKNRGLRSQAWVTEYPTCNMCPSSETVNFANWVEVQQHFEGTHTMSRA